MTNCVFVSDSGETADLIGDHFTIFAVQEKFRENKTVQSEIVRDYSRFDNINFHNLIDAIDWTDFYNELDPNMQ